MVLPPEVIREVDRVARVRQSDLRAERSDAHVIETSHRQYRRREPIFQRLQSQTPPPWLYRSRLAMGGGGNSPYATLSAIRGPSW